MLIKYTLVVHLDFATALDHAFVTGLLQHLGLFLLLPLLPLLTHNQTKLVDVSALAQQNIH
jgi:hypothetical protein